MIGLTKTVPGSGGLALTERAEARVKPGYVTLEVHGAGVCGTDLHIEAGEFPCTPPVTLGHEVCGVVVDTAAGEAQNWKGSRVVAETFYSTCGVCTLCRNGRPNLCLQRRSIGVHVDGAFASQVVVPIKNLHRIPDWLDEHAASIAEPLACTCQCMCDPSAVSAGDRVLVTGPGPVGLLAAQVARALGASPIVVGLPSDQPRLDVARKLNLDVALAGEDIGEVDVVLECSGHPAAAAAGLKAVKRGGTYVQLGIFGRDVTLPFDLILTKEIVIRSGFASTPHSWKRAMSLIEKKLVVLEPLVSTVAPLQSWADVFSDLRSGRALKIVIDPRLT
jgi:L-iditol 2-dehydrogenase